MDGWFSKLDEKLEKHLGADNVAKLRTVILSNIIYLNEKFD